MEDKTGRAVRCKYGYSRRTTLSGRKCQCWASRSRIDGKVPQEKGKRELLSKPPRTRLCWTDGVACPRGISGHVPVGEEGCHPLPHPVQPFGRSRRGEGGIDEGLVGR